jgi:hypothetical protein
MNRPPFVQRLLRFLPAALVAVICIANGDAVVFGQAGFTDEQFEQWVFQQSGNALTARARLKESLELYTDDVHRTCTLSDAQTRKLRLAGQGDIERFFRKYAEVKAEFQLNRGFQGKLTPINQHVSRMQARMATGFFDRDSLLQKSLVNTINREQFLKYAKVREKRRQFQHESKVKLVVTMLDQSSPLTAAQREKLADLFRRETRPARKSGQYDYYAIMYQVAKIPDDQIKPLLDDIQWQVFKQQFAQMGNMEPWLRQQGILDDDEEEEPLLPDEQVAAE